MTTTTRSDAGGGASYGGFGSAPTTFGPACRADFPLAEFFVDADPAAMRAAAQGYRAIADRMDDARATLEGATCASWTGTEGDTYRRSRAAYRPMLLAASEAFTGLHREVDRCATSIDDAKRRMESVRAAAEVAWARLQQEREVVGRSSVSPTAAPPGTPRLAYDVESDPQVAGLRRTYDQLLEEARALRRRVTETAQQTAAAIRGLTPPAAIPQPGASPYGPVVVSRDTYGAHVDGQLEVVVGGVLYEIVRERLDDGRVRTTVKAVAELGVGGTWTPLKLKVGEKDVTGLPEATAEAKAGAGLEAVWYADSDQEAQGQLAGALFGLAAHRGSPAALATMGSHAKAVGVHVALKAGVESNIMEILGRAANPTKTGEEVGAAGVSGTLRCDARKEWGADGSRETSIVMSAAGTAERPWLDDKGAPTQKSYDASVQTTASVRTAANGQAVLVVTSVTKGVGQENKYERRWARILTKEEAGTLDKGFGEMAANQMQDLEGSTAQRALRLVSDTTRSDADSPAVKNGAVDYSERTWEEETVAQPSLEGKLMGVGLEGGVEVRTEKATPVQRP